MALPAVVRFLGYDPFPSPTTLPERLLAKRREKGWTINRAARTVGVDPGTWRDWEAGRVVLNRNHRATLAALLGVNASALHARWKGAHTCPVEPVRRPPSRVTERWSR
jgi:transcriptional regulator with XRE-family HTH domain